MKAIVAVDNNWGIGCDNKLLFSIPEDMRYFVEFTIGKTVVMGRSTFESLPGVPNPKPLKNRANIVLSSDRNLKIDGVAVCNSIEELFKEIGNYNRDDVIVIGGEAVYRQLLDYCDEVRVTKVKAAVKADRFFPDLDKSDNWKKEHESEEKEHNGFKYSFLIYKRIT